MTSRAPDATMELIARAVEAGGTGDPDQATADLIALWVSTGPDGDPLHRCTIAHHLADLCLHPAEALAWDVRALDAADALTDQRAQEHHEALQVAGFYPSLHLNLADDYRCLGAFEAAAHHIERARAYEHRLAEDGYGTLIRRAINEVGEAVDARSTARRGGAPGPGAGADA